MVDSRHKGRSADTAASTPSEEWARRMQRGDADAVGKVRERVRRILAFRRLKIPKQDRDDLEQEIMTEVWQAVNQTKGQVLTCRQSDDTQDIFPSYYSSTCGGHTENSENVFGDSYPSLIGVACPYCQNVAKPRFFFWPMTQFDKDDVIRKLLQKYPTLKRLGNITSLSAADQTDHGEFSRLTKIRLLGSKGKSDFVRAEDLRLTIDPTGRKLRSTICQIMELHDKWAFLSGRGWGHGVGMCQCGAEGMARRGKTTEQILSHYYPKSKIQTIDY